MGNRYQIEVEAFACVIKDTMTFLTQYINVQHRIQASIHKSLLIICLLRIRVLLIKLRLVTPKIVAPHTQTKSGKCIQGHILF